MENKISISFIIPAHNAEKVLKRSVESVVRGAGCDKYAKHMEIIIIENASSDYTEQVGKTLEETYENVYLTYSEKGVSSARNAGMQMARGEWIFFLDADDYLPNGAISSLFSEIDEKEEADLYIFSYEKGKDVVFVTENSCKEMEQCRKSEECLKEMLCNPTRCMAVWGKLFKKSIIQKHALIFNSELNFAEDSDFLIRYIRRSHSIMFSKKKCYHYSTDNNSVMRTYDGKKAEGYLRSLEVTQEEIPEDNKALSYAYQIYILMHLNVIMVREVFATENTMAFSDKVKTLKKILKHKLFSRALDAVSVKECKSARMLPILLLKCHLYSLCGTIYALRAKQNARREELE